MQGHAQHSVDRRQPAARTNRAVHPAKWQARRARQAARRSIWRLPPRRQWRNLSPPFWLRYAWRM